LAGGLFLSCSSHDFGVSADLFDQVDEIAVSVRAIGRTSLVSFAEEVDGCVEAVDRRFAELEERCRRRAKILCVAQAISYGTSKDKKDRRTHRSEKEKSLFKISEVGDELGTNSSWNVFNEGMKLLERLFLQNRGYDALFNVIDGLRGEEVFGRVLRGADVGC